MTTKKLDTEHLTAIKLLQEQFSENSANIGNVSLDIELLQYQKIELEDKRSDLVKQFLNLREQETQLLKTLESRYGDGKIDVIEGTFTSND